MNKKKLVSLCLVLALVLTAVIGGTMAYYTDTDEATNTFTTGNVDITLIEDFEQDSKLMPGVDVKKEVYVKNEGSETAYVRVHVAFPAILDSGSEDLPQFAAYNNTLHWNFTAASVQEGAWSQLQSSDQVGPNASYPNWPGNGGTYNTYQATVNGVLYNVYVITYETALGAGKTTPTPAINKVYLDTSVTNEEMTGILNALKVENEDGKVISEGIKVLVFAEGGQQAGFTDPYEALNEQFGNPMAAGYVAPWNR